MELQEPIYDNMSQDVTAGAVMWLQEQDVAVGVKMRLHDKLLKKNFGLLSLFLVVQISQPFGAALLDILFARSQF